MSLTRLMSVFENLNTTTDWSLQLLKISTSKKEGTSYASRQITLSPTGKLAEFVGEITDKYTSPNKNMLTPYSGVEEYDGTAQSTKIYKMSSTNPLIATEYATLIEKIANPDHEANLLEFNYHAYVIRGIVKINGIDTRVKLISMQNPISLLKHKFMCDGGTFKELSDKVLSLKSTVEVIIVDDTIYFLTMAGERLFNMERAYKTICCEKVDTVLSMNLVSDSDTFKAVAESGHNPRRFVSFNEGRLNVLKNKNRRSAMANKFSIPMKDGKFDMKIDGTAEKVVKLLCNKGMIDPFEDIPVEVTSAKKWL